jgi:urea transporter
MSYEFIVHVILLLIQITSRESYIIDAVLSIMVDTHLVHILKRQNVPNFVLSFLQLKTFID